MAYEFSREHRTVWWPAKVSVPVDGGDTVEAEFELQITIPKSDDWEEIEKLPKKKADEKGKAYIHDWRGITENKEQVPFNRDTLDALMKDGYFAAAVSRALLQASVGARAKN